MPSTIRKLSPGAGRPWEALLAVSGLVLLLAALAVWVAWRPPSRGAAVSPYVGAASCRACHPGEWDSHRASNHARALHPAAELARVRQLDGREVEDPELPSVRWRYAVRDGQVEVERRDGTDVERWIVEYAFGSGRYATTFVTRLIRDPAHCTALEHRLSLFGPSGTLGLTPGHTSLRNAPNVTSRGRVLTASKTRACFSCHTTTTSDRGPAAVDPATMIPNISCERCHGPGRAHVEAARRGASPSALAMRLGSGHTSADELLRACAECHRVPEKTTPEAIRPDNPNIVRYQPVGLAQSACYTKSRGALSCTTCHDPHARPTTNSTWYESVCLQCHGPRAKAVSCPVSERSGCIDCHMPRREVRPGMSMADHWIRVAPSGRL